MCMSVCFSSSSFPSDKVFSFFVFCVVRERGRYGEEERKSERDRERLLMMVDRKKREKERLSFDVEIVNHYSLKEKERK